MAGTVLILLAVSAMASAGSVLDGLLRREHHPEEHIPHITTTLTTTVFTLPLPTLPAITLPALPTRATVTSIKTIFLETTKVSTIHPVCLTVTQNLPPCVSMPKPQIYPLPAAEESYQYLAPLPPQPLPPQPIPEPYHEHYYRPKIQPTAAIHLPEVQETRIAGEVEQSEPVDEADNERTARYLVAHPEPAPEIRTTAEETADAQLSMVDAQLRQGLVDRLIPPVLVVATKTLWVTKVNKVINDQVTATLVAANCLPVQNDIPFCHHQLPPPPPPPPYHLSAPKRPYRLPHKA